MSDFGPPIIAAALVVLALAVERLAAGRRRPEYVLLPGAARKDGKVTLPHMVARAAIKLVEPHIPGAALVYLHDGKVLITARSYDELVAELSA